MDGFVIARYDSLQVGEVIKRFEAKGFKLVGIKLLHPTPAMAAAHYKDLSSKPVCNILCELSCYCCLLLCSFDIRMIILLRDC